LAKGARRRIIDRRERIVEILHRRYRQVGASSAMPVSFEEISNGFDVVETGGFGEHEAFVCRQTGKVYCRFGLSVADEDDEMNDELPDDIEDESKYIAIPDKKTLGLGKPLVLDFAREFLSKDFDEVRDIFSKRGAYRKFRALVIRRNVLERWYDFEAKASERALREWCEFNSIELAD
jgi:hypothetical protein